MAQNKIFRNEIAIGVLTYLLGLPEYFLVKRYKLHMEYWAKRLSIFEHFLTAILSAIQACCHVTSDLMPVILASINNLKMANFGALVSNLVKYAPMVLKIVVHSLFGHN